MSALNEKDRRHLIRLDLCILKDTFQTSITSVIHNERLDWLMDGSGTRVLSTRSVLEANLFINSLFSTYLTYGIGRSIDVVRIFGFAKLRGVILLPVANSCVPLLW